MYYESFYLLSQSQAGLQLSACQLLCVPKKSESFLIILFGTLNNISGMTNTKSWLPKLLENNKRSSCLLHLKIKERRDENKHIKIQFPFHQGFKPTETVWLKYCPGDILTIPVSSNSVIWGKKYAGSVLPQTSSVLGLGETDAFMIQYKSNIWV